MRQACGFDRLKKGLAIDSEVIETWAKGKRDPSESSDSDADWGQKTYRGKKKDGGAWKKVKKWFGYKVHLMVDANYELPVGYEVTRASVNDSPRLVPMLEDLSWKHPEVVANAERLSADKGYDSKKNNQVPWDKYEVNPLIDVCHKWTNEPEAPRFRGRQKRRSGEFV